MNYQVVMINQLLYDTPLYQPINKGTFTGEIIIIIICLKLRVSINVHKIILNCNLSERYCDPLKLGALFSDLSTPERPGKRW